MLLFDVFHENCYVIADSNQSRIAMGDLFRFLAGCPRLEEAHIYNIQWDPFHTPPSSPPPLSLPHLKYLHCTYRRHRDSGWEEGADPIEYLLSRTSIPPTCHLYFTVDGSREESDGTNRGILANVCRHIHEKNAVSRVLFWLVD